MVFGPPGGINSAHGVHSFKARPGHHLAPAPLSQGKNTFESLGNGYTLLAFDAQEAAVNEFRHAAQELGIPLSVVCDSRSEGREEYEAALILVRPDQYVAWAGEKEVADAPAILRRATGR